MDITSVLATMKSILLSAFTNNLPAAVSAVNQYIASGQTRLQTIADGAISGDLSFAEVTTKLNDEAENLRDELFSIEQIALSDLQTFINQAISIFQTSIQQTIIQAQQP